MAKYKVGDLLFCLDPTDLHAPSCKGQIIQIEKIKCGYLSYSVIVNGDGRKSHSKTTFSLSISRLPGHYVKLTSLGKLLYT